MINNADYETFFPSTTEEDDDEDENTQLCGTRPIPKNYLKFTYAYSVCCADRKRLGTWLSDKALQADPKNHVFKKITTSDEA